MRSRDHGRPWRGLHCGGPAFRWTALVAIVIGALVTFAYRHTGGAPFLLDDGPSILDNPGVAGGPWSAAAWTPPPWSFTAGRPVLNWSFAASAGLCGMDAACFRRANVALHALNAVLLFLLVVEALRAAGISARLRVSPAVVGAACAVVWAVNPLHTAAVTYVSQRAEVLMGTFLLGTVLCFLRGLLSGRPALWRTLAAAAFAAGVMTKETVVSAPLVCLLLERAAGRGRGRGLRRGDWRDYAGFAPGLLLFAMLAASSALASRLAVAEGGWIGADTFVLQLRAIGEYALLCLWPHPLVFDRGTSGLALAAYPVWSGVMVLLLAAAGVRRFSVAGAQVCPCCCSCCSSPRPPASYPCWDSRSRITGSTCRWRLSSPGHQSLCSSFCPGRAVAPRGVGGAAARADGGAQRRLSHGGIHLGRHGFEGAAESPRPRVARPRAPGRSRTPG